MLFMLRSASSPMLRQINSIICSARSPCAQFGYNSINSIACSARLACAQFGYNNVLANVYATDCSAAVQRTYVFQLRLAFGSSSVGLVAGDTATFYILGYHEYRCAPSECISSALCAFHVFHVHILACVHE